MNKENKVNIVFTCLKLNTKTGKWDVKILNDGKVKWIRGFSNETDAFICAKSYQETNKLNN